MDKVCRTEKEFAEAVKNKESVIIIEGDLKKHVFDIKLLVNLDYLFRSSYMSV